jgi:flagellar biosynthesis/type III secretory pathway ATPase
MKYIIAKRDKVYAEGIKPAAKAQLNGYMVLNENELKYTYPQLQLEESASRVDGVIVDRLTAIEFINGTKDIADIKTELDNE